MARKKKTRRKRRRKAGVTIAHTAAFELCESGTCGEVKGTKNTEKKIWCHLADTCSKGGCYCQLFRRERKAPEDDPWLVTPVDHEHLAKYDPDKWDYKCICVSPVFELTHTDDGVDYTARLQLCGTGDCTLLRQKASTVDKLTCAGQCADEKCKCTLFRLKMSGEPEKAKWELVAKALKGVPHENGYYYRCFCLK